MANAPWYLKTGESDGPSLKHHKANIPKYNRDPSKLESRFERGAKAVRDLLSSPSWARARILPEVDSPYCD